MDSPAPAILQIAESGQADALYDELRSKCDSSLYYFAKVVMNYRDLTDNLHLPFCDVIQSVASEPIQGFLMPRAHFKSTIRTKAYMLWRYLHNHELRFLNIGASDTIAKKALIDIKWHILNNQLLRWLYPELKSVDTGQTKWTDAEILLPREGTFDEPTITCDGINAKRTGFHYNEIIFDDPVADVDADSQPAHEAAWDFMQYSRGLLHDPEQSTRTIIGTRWKHGTADVYGKAMEGMPSCKWYIRSAIEDGLPIFPERFSLATLAKIRDELKDYKFNCQYMNNPTMPGSTDFEPSWLKEYEVHEDGRTIIPCDGTPRVSTGKLLRISFYDPSGGGKSAQCENAIVFIGTAADRRIFVLEDYGENTTIGKAVERWHVMNDRWRCYENFYERKGAQSSVEDFCRERTVQKECPYCQAGHLDGEGRLYLRNPHLRIIAKPFSHPGAASDKSKEERIRFYAQKAFEEGRVYFRRGMTAIRRQITQFPHGELVDRFDALATAIKLSRPPLSDADEESANAVHRAHTLAGKPRISSEYDRGGYA